MPVKFLSFSVSHLTRLRIGIILSGYLNLLRLLRLYFCNEIFVVLSPARVPSSSVGHRVSAFLKITLYCPTFLVDRDNVVASAKERK